MAAARKSAVSATGTRFRRDSTPSSGKRRSARSASTVATETSSVSSRRQRRSAKDLSVSAPNRGQLDNQQVFNHQEQSSTTQKNPKTGSLRLPAMPTTGATSLWLLRLSKLHRYSSVVAFLLVAATLVVYGWTVYSQELWSQDYAKIQNLRRNERQLTTTNATLKNKMAEEAEQPTAGLVSPTPARTIFVPLAPSNQNSTLPNTKPNPQTQQQTPSPLGY
ncbi:hypothetical protein I8752_35655 [Nostocaceae cyanobacterium CENA369]|uniref:Cell division protein FtsL n=1 Tax=Dendronalium phyllosphericum CENA369 TaxID=1725256 RepID=A0A8J7IA62_9NOST|nr:hypothetical protein [Dendronalium phyllosphericum]MBH8578189.1 hypothetical protein [Dendronalium phyllosphericum CENA369]